MTLIEEHADRISEYELLQTYHRANNLLGEIQDADTVARLRACASRIVSARLATIRPRRSRSLVDVWANFNLPERVRAYEARYIQRALIDAEGSVSRAARLLGFIHHATLVSMLATRHKDLAHLRTPPEKRRRSTVRLRQPHETRECKVSQTTRSASILHVEDNQLVANMVRDALALEGCVVQVCTAGTAALNKLAGGAHYDLLIFDNDLPGATGLELIQYARQLPQYQHTPIIMLSTSDCQVAALRAGATIYLKKPEDIYVLTETVKRLLSTKTTGH